MNACICSLFFSKMTTSSAYNNIQQRILPFNFLCAHMRLHRPVVVQHLLEESLANVCALSLAFEVWLPSILRNLPAAKDCTLSNSSLSPTRLYAACTLFAAKSSSNATTLAFQYARLLALRDFLQPFNASLYCFHHSVLLYCHQYSNPIIFLSLYLLVWHLFDHPQTRPNFSQECSST